MNEAPLGLLFGILAALIVLSGFFSGSETGMMSLNRYRMRHRAKSGHRGAKRAAKLLEEPDSLISTILIGNNLVNNLAASIATIVAIRLYGDNAVVPASILLTLVFLIFAEIIPKTIAAYKSETVAYTVSHALLPLKAFLFPVIWLVSHVTQFVLRLTRIEKNDGTEHIGLDELRTIVGEAGHLIPKHHKGMLMNILDLEQITVDDIMIPRNEVFGIDVDADTDTIIRKLRDAEFTRIPVYQNDIDNIVGILHQRDIINSVDAQGRVQRDALLQAIRDPYFIPEGTPLNTQLFNFQKQKRRMGIVVDEYGVMQGIVTLEDLLEEIVGEFTSNLSTDTEDIVHQADGTYLVDGTTTIRDINKSMKWDLPTDGPKTLNGLLLEKLESFPEGSVGLTIDRYYFEILEMKGNLIQSVRAYSKGKNRR
ncbi:MULTISPECIES: HlyC/CorC family transporter [Zhongshania]|uniref:HlyC/CorC family transporter n=1 Tax=Zhongshania aquimaris TaxID=2857107 RepID=A0ABS6VMM3_9GAMM|nr:MULTISPECIES: HlyC/CorC family transporter [Zhongshania]MBQ0796512.1 HlyC/CorC family transporter [Zhongshania sp.]MBW2939546.1 HlyC/CorC family transporter [Zhongshania aquimaris]